MDKNAKKTGREPVQGVLSWVRSHRILIAVAAVCGGLAIAGWHGVRLWTWRPPRVDSQASPLALIQSMESAIAARELDRYGRYLAPEARDMLAPLLQSATEVEAAQDAAAHAVKAKIGRRAANKVRNNELSLHLVEALAPLEASAFYWELAPGDVIPRQIDSAEGLMQSAGGPLRLHHLLIRGRSNSGFLAVRRGGRWEAMPRGMADARRRQQLRSEIAELADAVMAIKDAYDLLRQAAEEGALNDKEFEEQFTHLMSSSVLAHLSNSRREE